MDINYEDLFGLEPEETPEGEEEQDVADPVETEEPEGGEEQEIADPAETDEGEEEPEEEDQPEEEPEKKPQTPEERRAQAAARRQREQQEAIDAAVAAERKRNQEAWDAHYRAMNLRDPYHGNKPVTTQAEYDAYVEARDQQALERDLKAGKITPERYQADVQRAAQAAARQQAEAAQRAAEGRAEVDRQFAALQAAYPSVKSLGELMQDQAFVAALPVTRDMTRAYRMAHVDEIEASAKAAAQAGRDSGKSHLRRAGTRGGGAPMVTQDVIDQYRIFDPNVTIEEIRAYEAKYQKTKKR